MRFNFITSQGKQVSITQQVTQLILKVFGVPHLGTRIRYRLISKVLKKTKKSPHILDAGCGYGFISLMLKNWGLVTAVDNNPQRLKVAKRIGNGINFISADLSRLPFKNQLFDLTLCLEVLEHLKNDLTALKELRRVTKNKGKIIISFPESEANQKAYANFGHVRAGYTKGEIINLSQKVGLKIDQFMPYGRSLLGKSILEIDYNLSKISPLLSSLAFPFLFPLAFFDQFLPAKNPWNYIVVLTI